jgi:putative Mn2+ efflux pump MntP
MGVLDAIVGGAFRDEPAGRVVVFSGDRRNRGYVVRSEAEELKIKSFLKMFYFAHFYILMLGLMLANAWSTFVTHLEGMGRPAGHMLRNMSIAIGVYCLVVGLPNVLLWRSYKKALPSFVSSQDEVVVSDQSKRQQQWKLVLVILGLALLAMGVGLAFLVRVK